MDELLHTESARYREKELFMHQISSQFIMKPESVHYKHSTIRIKKNFLLNVSCILWLGNGTFRMIIAKILSVVNMQQLAEYILSFLI
ncbi:MAG: hypothetical protein K2F73_00015, partial [Ruminococcus sp.]|nr:hypothetical protein [Ruminococcus sp.]